MVNTTEANDGLRRRQELKERIKEINDRLPAMIAGVEERLAKKQSPRPGLIFLATAPPAVHGAEEETSASVMLLEHEGDRLWICCKISVETFQLGSFDLLIDSDEWTGGFPILLEAWNPVLLHEDDMKDAFFEAVNSKWVDMAGRLFHAYQHDGVIPEDLAELTGLDDIEEDDVRLAFRLKEMDVMERIRIYYHEESKREQTKVISLSDEKQKREQRKYSSTITLFEVSKAADTKGVDLDQLSHHVLLKMKESGIFEVALVQDRDEVYLRVYSGESQVVPESIFVQGKPVEIADRVDCREVPLGKSDLMPLEMRIEIIAQESSFVLELSFHRKSGEDKS